MSEEILLKEGAVYKLWTPGNEPNDFEPMIKYHIRDIFGNRCEYFPKRKLKTLADNRSIPDGFVIDFENQRWYIVELKLLCDDAIKRIAGQIVSYKTAVENPRNQRNIYKSIKSIKDADFLDDLINDEKPEIVIIINSLNGELGEQFKEQVEGTDKNIRIIVFKTFAREHVNPKMVHIHLFKPLHECKYSKEQIETLKEPQISDYPSNKIEVVFTDKFKEYSLIQISKFRHFFPGYLMNFTLDTDIGDIKAKVTSAPKGTRKGDPDAGSYIKSVARGKLKPWYDAHPELKPGDKLIIEAVGPNRYRLRISSYIT